MKQLLISMSVIALVGCTSTQNHPSVVNGRSCPVQRGVVLDTQPVTIERNTDTAQAVGAGLGGFIANKATGDKGEVTRVLATAAGVAAGAVAGDRIADATQDLAGIELIVKLDRGTHSIVQQSTPYSFQAGDAVWVVGYPDSSVYSRTNCGNDTRVFPVRGQ